ncbi:UV radiation resistance protein/autophagy-related protein 14 [Auriculariales sp. MPI-PUGE-AT-0066]|nr:UV radiation resistance protein/autophagy-related protein 14 [Auriculariales sp. MPI-PUGE-AT-0066]
MAATMECHVCEQRQRQFYCVDCLRGHLRDFRNRQSIFNNERVNAIARGERLLHEGGVQAARMERADAAAAEQFVNECKEEVARLRGEADKQRARMSNLKASLGARRQALAAARAHMAPVQSRDGGALAQAHLQAQKLATELAQTRALLCHHLLNVFGVQEVRGEWRICGLVLPVLGDVRRYPPEHINTALQHTLHLLRVLTFYLGVKLPFEVTYGRGQPTDAAAPPSRDPAAPMRPWIRAGSGGESGSWAKWIHSQPLFVLGDKTKGSSITPGATSSSSSSAGDWTGVTAEATKDRSRTAPESFTTALTMLMYNVAYVAHTQGLEIGLAQAQEVLRNIWAVCCAPGVGRMSHETGRPSLPPPTPAGFVLDFQQLLQVTSAAPTVRRTREKDRERRRSGRRVDDDDEWDLIEAES